MQALQTQAASQSRTLMNRGGLSKASAPAEAPASADLPAGGGMPPPAFTQVAPDEATGSGATSLPAAEQLPAPQPPSPVANSTSLPAEGTLLTPHFFQPASRRRGAPKPKKTMTWTPPPGGWQPLKIHQASLPLRDLSRPHLRALGDLTASHFAAQRSSEQHKKSKERQRNIWLAKRELGWNDTVRTYVPASMRGVPHARCPTAHPYTT